MGGTLFDRGRTEHGAISGLFRLQSGLDGNLAVKLTATLALSEGRRQPALAGGAGDVPGAVCKIGGLVQTQSVFLHAIVSSRSRVHLLCTLRSQVPVRETGLEDGAGG